MDAGIARDHNLTPEADCYFQQCRQIIKEYVTGKLAAKAIYDDLGGYLLSTKQNGVCN